MGGGTTSKDIAKFESKKICENIFEDILEEPMFEKLPEHATTGEKLTHLWRLLDEEHFMDMKQPPRDEYDIYARIQNGQKLDFSEDGIKLASAWHVSKCSDYRFTKLPKWDKSQRPLLSWSKNPPTPVALKVQGSQP